MTTPLIGQITPDQLMIWLPTIGLPCLGAWLIWKTRLTNRQANSDISQSVTVDKTIHKSKICFELYDRYTTDMRTGYVYKKIILIVRNSSDVDLEGIKVLMTHADGPEDWETIDVPRTMEFPSHMNPKDYIEITLSEYQESPPSQYIGYNMGGIGVEFHGFKATTSCQFRFFATATRSLPADVAVKILVDDNQKLRFNKI